MSLTAFEQFQLAPPAQLDPSDLTDQLEALGDEIDVSSLNLTVAGKTALQVRQAITSATITRTIRGASTLKIVIEDSDLAITRSGYVGGSGLTVTPAVNAPTRSGIAFNSPVDCEIDGLFFRLVQVDKDDQSYSVTLTFEDREIAVLRSYPHAGDPHTYEIFAGLNRIAVMEKLILEPTEYAAVGGIRWWSPLAAQAVPPVTTLFDPLLRRAFPSAYTGPPAPTQTQVAAQKAANAARQPGFAPPPVTVTGGGFTVSTPTVGAAVTVKGQPASAAQLAVLDAVIRAGYTAGVASWIIVAAVATVTDESDAGQDVGTDPHAVGVFQQDPSEGYGGVQSDIVTDAANAFYSRAVAAASADFTLQGNPALLAATVQRPLAFLQSGTTSMYGGYVAEATSTVDTWLGNDDPNLPPPNLKGPTATAATSPYAPSTPAIVGAAVFSRGSMTNQGGKMTVVTENNWQTLVRLANEVGWLIFCVSGTIYITDWSIFRSAVRMRIRDQGPGVDGIGFSIDTAKEAARVTVTCRISRWGAPPGSVVAIDDMGPASGRWLVESIERDLFTFTGTITLVKPQTTLKDAQSASPVQGIQILQPSGLVSTQQAAQVVAGDVSGGRSRIVAAAQRALASRGNYVYSEQTSGPTSRDATVSLFQPPPVYCDCSSFVTLCYKAAGLPDPNGLNYSPLGFTGTLIANGTPTTSPQPGDLLFYYMGGTKQRPGHVVLWVGDGQGTVISMSDPSQGLNSYPAPFWSTDPNVIGIYTYNMGLPA